MPTYRMQAPDGNTYSIPGPEGATDDQIREQIIAQHPHLGDPELKGFDPHHEEVGAGGIYKRAGAALPGSVASNVSETAQGLWSIITHPKEAASALYELGPSGIKDAIVDDISKHYGSFDRAQKTLEQDPFRFIMDAATVVTGGAGLLRKLGMTIVKPARTIIPPIAGKASGEMKIRPEAFRAAGEAGELGGQAAQEFRTGIPIGQQAAAGGPRPTAGASIPYFQEAGEAIGSGGWMPQKLRDPALAGAGAEMLLHGAVPGAGGAMTAAGIAASSPRLMGETMYGLGATERGLRQLPTAARAGTLAAGTLTRDQLQAQAKELLKDKERKKDLTNPEIKIVRAAARGNADSRMMQAAQSILGRRLPAQPAARIERTSADLPDYGGPSGDVVSRQEGGPVEAGQRAVVGEQGPETFVPSVTGPAASPGLAREPVTGEVPVAPTRGGQTFFQFAWDKLLEGGKDMIPSLMEEGKKAFMAPEEYDPSGPLGMAAGMTGARLPFARAGELGAGGGKLVQPARELTAAEKAAPKPDAPFPQYAEEYPPVGEPVQTWDAKKGRYYPAKGESPEAAAFLKARDKIREDMKREGYTPYFDPAKRTHVDPARYPERTTETLDIIPKTPKALAAHLKTLNAPEVLKRLRAAIKKGQTLGDTADWYAMGQLESEFIKEFGAKKGSTEFLNTFAAPMAATTGGMDPTGNLLLASYLNYLRSAGKAIPTESWQVPKGFGGGKYGVMPNIRQYQTKMEGGGYSAFGEENPKRLDFMRAFLGDRYHPVMDEQMTQGMTPGLSQPPPGTYGLYGRKALEAGKNLGLTPDDVQAIAWAGFKDERGKPMIAHFNDAVERTYRLTGMPRKEIVRRWMRKEIPLYGGAGATIMAAGAPGETPSARQ